MYFCSVVKSVSPRALGLVDKLECVVRYACACEYMCVCVRARVCACTCVCVHACVRVCVRVVCMRGVNHRFSDSIDYRPL